MTEETCKCGHYRCNICMSKKFKPQEETCECGHSGSMHSDGEHTHTAECNEQIGMHPDTDEPIFCPCKKFKAQEEICGNCGKREIEHPVFYDNHGYMAISCKKFKPQNHKEDCKGCFKCDVTIREPEGNHNTEGDKTLSDEILQEKK